MQTYHNYESTLQVYLMKPSKSNKQLSDLALFLAHVSHCFPDELKAYPQQLIDILKRYATVLHPDVRLVKFNHVLKIKNEFVWHFMSVLLLKKRLCVNVWCSYEIKTSSSPYRCLSRFFRSSSVRIRYCAKRCSHTC